MPDPVDSLATLTALTTLTSLTLRGARSKSSMGLWGVMAALPRLAHLNVRELPMMYHSAMPGGAQPLAALTRLELMCSADMVKPDARRGVDVPVLQVLLCCCCCCCCFCCCC